MAHWWKAYALVVLALFIFEVLPAIKPPRIVCFEDKHGMLWHADQFEIALGCPSVLKIRQEQGNVLPDTGVGGNAR